VNVIVFLFLSLLDAGCKDIDDALHCIALPNGNFDVGVRILSLRASILLMIHVSISYTFSISKIISYGNDYFI